MQALILNSNWLQKITKVANVFYFYRKKSVVRGLLINSSKHGDEQYQP